MDILKIHNAIDLVIRHYKVELVNIIKLPTHRSQTLFKIRRFPFDSKSADTAVFGFLCTEENVLTHQLRFITFFTPPGFGIHEILRYSDFISAYRGLTQCVLVYEDTAIFNFKRII